MHKWAAPQPGEPQTGAGDTEVWQGVPQRLWHPSLPGKSIHDTVPSPFRVVSCLFMHDTAPTWL